MADAAPVTTQVEKIEAHDASVVAAISALADRCLVDARDRTLFDAAILADNAELITLLSSDRDALEFAAPVDAKLVEQIKQAAADFGVKVPISKLEAYLENVFGGHLPWGRTPLHTACRAGNTSAIQTLLAAGAKTNAKDAIGFTAPELAYFAHGEKGLRDFLAVFERSGQAKLAVGKRLLRESFCSPEAVAKLLEHCKLDAAARRLLFCYRCAWLDTDAVRSMLAEGHDPNEGVTIELNPVWEACTSAMLWDDAIPGGFEMAFHYTKYLGHPGASSVSFDNDLLNESGSSIWKLLAGARRERRAQIRMVRKMKIKPDAEREVIGRRIALLDVLLDAGADVALARKKLEYVKLGELKEMKLGDVADHLKQRGGKAVKPPKKRKPAASTWWDLVGETGLNTEYWPGEGDGGLLRLILHNVYGPVDGVTLSVLLSRNETKPDGEWRDLEPVNETVEVEGEPVSRAELTEPVYGEAPWEASYELPLNGVQGAKVLWIRLDHKDEEELCLELDPWRFAKD